MNKNTLLAIVLSFTILIAWSIYMRKKSGPVKIDKTPPIFKGIKKVTPDYKNGYLKLKWDPAEDNLRIVYGVFISQTSEITQFNNPAYYTTNTSFIISDLDMSKNYYFAVRAIDQANNRDNNIKQIYLKSKYKDFNVSEKKVEYENKVAIYHFSTLGGRLKNIILKDYKTMDGKEQVNLLNYPKQVLSHYYPLDIKVYSSKDDNTILKINDQARYTSRKKGNKIFFSSVINKDLKIIKEYVFKENNYDFTLNIKLSSTAGYKSASDAYDRIAVKWQPTLGPVNKLDKYDNLVYAYYAEEKLEEEGKGGGCMGGKKTLNKIIIKRADNIKWICFHNRYFIAAIMPTEKYKIKETFFYSDGKNDIGGIISSIDNNKLRTQGVEYNYTIYAGPKIRATFKNNKQLSGLGKAISGRSFILPKKFVNAISSVFFEVLLFIYKFVKSYGLAIIIFTILIKIVLYPLTHKQFESMVKMQKIQPIITQVREQYKSDAQMMNKELMKVYKKYKVNPLGGCLPLLMQLPIFIAIWNMLQSAIELRTAPFLWIKSLAMPDTVGYIGTIPINILPIFMGVTMLYQQTMTGTGGASKQKSMMYFMPLIFLVMFWNMPSGLVLYWSVQNVLSIGQQLLIKKYQKVETGGETK